LCQPPTSAVAYGEVDHDTEGDDYAGDRTHDGDYIAQVWFTVVCCTIVC